MLMLNLISSFLSGKTKALPPLAKDEDRVPIFPRVPEDSERVIPEEFSSSSRFTRKKSSLDSATDVPGFFQYTIELRWLSENGKMAGKDSRSRQPLQEKPDWQFTMTQSVLEGLEVI